eukprot:3663076-Karenia_brevis.AAC.1
MLVIVLMIAIIPIIVGTVAVEAILANITIIVIIIMVNVNIMVIVKVILLLAVLLFWTAPLRSELLD